MVITSISTRTAQLLALSEAAELLLCAIRALAVDHPDSLSEATRPAEWALAKIEEARVLPLEGR